MHTLLLLAGLLAGALASCPTGWVAPPNGDIERCFRFETSGLDWNSARRMCQSAKAELLSIRSQAEKDWVHEEVLRYTLKKTDPVWHWWSGLNALNTPKDWAWTDGTAIDGSLIQWGPNQPDTASPDEKCGELHRDGFNDNRCTTVFPYICARDKDIPAEICPFGKVLEGRLCVPLNPGTTSGSTTSSTTTTTTTTTSLPPGPEPVQGACTEDWVESPDVPATCYRFVAGPNKWEEAKDLCELAKGHLVSISSTAEKTWVEGQVRRLGHERSSWFGLYKWEALPSWWTGLHRTSSSEAWQWHSRATFNSQLIKWQSGEPNNRYNENCGELNVNGFNDNGCTQRFPFICARPKAYKPSANDCPFGQQRSNSAKGAPCVPYVLTTTPAPTRPAQGVTAGPVPAQGACPIGWVESSPVSDRCYRVETTMKKTWGEAQKVCQAARGDLFTMRNSAERAWAVSQVKRVSKSLWVGLHRQGADSTWKWVDQTPATDIWWQKGEPNHDFEKCGELFMTGFNDNSCWRSYGFICARRKDLVPDSHECPFGQVLMGRSCEPLTLPTPVPLTQGTCAEGWVESPVVSTVTSGRCYRFVEDSLSHDDAKKMCRAANGDLVNAHDSTEKAWLQRETLNMATKKQKGTWTVGLKKDGETWKWGDGQVMDRPATASLVVLRSGLCGSMSPDGITTTNCWRTNPYICARPKVLPATTHLCPWGETWTDSRCQKYEVNNYHTKYDYINNMDTSRIEDELKELEGRHDREMAALRETFQGQITHLKRRIHTLETALRPGSNPVNPRRPVDFDPALTLIVMNVPQTENEVPHEVARRFLTDGLGLTDASITHARRINGSPAHPGHLKIEFSSAEGRQSALAARTNLDTQRTYRDISMRVPHMRRPINKSVRKA